MLGFGAGLGLRECSVCGGRPTIFLPYPTLHLCQVPPVCCSSSGRSGTWVATLTSARVSCAYASRASDDATCRSTAYTSPTRNHRATANTSKSLARSTPYRRSTTTNTSRSTSSESSTGSRLAHSRLTESHTYSDERGYSPCRLKDRHSKCPKTQRKNTPSTQKHKDNTKECKRRGLRRQVYLRRRSE